MYDIILFDLDGTITRSEIGIVNAIIYALSKFDIIPNDKEILKKFIGPPLGQSFIKHFDFTEEKSKEAVTYCQKYMKEKDGEYKIVVASGTADLYYNGQFAASWRMPRSDKTDFVTHSGIDSFVIGGSGVKTALYAEKWSGEAEYYRRLANRAPNYSLEFDKTDASDEKILFYDGEYKIELEIRGYRRENIQPSFTFLF